MQKIKYLLNRVKEEPEKYIGKPDAELLNSFIDGIIVYHLIAENNGIIVLPGFRDFICKKYTDPGIDYSFMKIICMNSRNKEEAFYKFYELLEEFIDKSENDYQQFVALKFEKN